MSKKSSESGIKEALSEKLARPLDPANLSNDAATLRTLAGQLNAGTRGMEDVPVDPTKYSGPTGAANTTLIIDSIPHESNSPEAKEAVLPPPDYNPHTTEFPLAAPPAQATTSTVLKSNRLRFVFTGRNLSEIIKLIGATEFALDSCARKLAALFFPAAKQDSPGFQDFVETIYAWGTGEVTTEYPASPERAVFQMMVRSVAKGLPAGINWAGFGANAGFWTDSVVASAKEFAEKNPTHRIVFTGLPDLIALRYFQGLDCTHWHITGRPGTVVDTLSGSLDQDVIKTLSSARSGPRLRCVWGENSPAMPRLWALSEFVNSFR